MRPNYGVLLRDVKEMGMEIDSRHGPTHEELGLTYTLGPGEMLRRDNINYTIGYIEAIQLIAGIYAPHMYVQMAPNSQHVLFTLNMAYGPRVALQVPRAIAALKADNETRQAVIFVGKPEDGISNDQPCTTTIQWLLRGSRLVSVVSMRSNDLVKGLPYDGMMFSALNMVAAHILGVYPGWTRITAGSAHVYDRDANREAKESSRRFILNPRLPKDWAQIQKQAQAMTQDMEYWSPAVGAKHLVPGLFEEVIEEEAD